MKELTIDDIKNISVEGLRLFHDLCMKHNLRYYLAYGTLLGAVRHKGFIPWDDDIDLWMPRRDYEAMLSLKESFKTDEWELLSSNYTKGYYLSWTKFCNKKTAYLPSRFKSGILYGVPIDIFPLDIVPTPLLKNEKHDIFRILKRMQERFLKPVYWRRLVGDKPSFGLKDKIKYLLANSLYPSAEYTLKSFSNTLIDWTKYENSSSMVCCVQTPVIKIFNKSSFDEVAILEFEGHHFNAPGKYDIVLRDCYDDYMTLPPIEQRRTHHNFIAVFK